MKKVWTKMAAISIALSMAVLPAATAFGAESEDIDTEMDKASSKAISSTEINEFEETENTNKYAKEVDLFVTETCESEDFQETEVEVTDTESVNLRDEEIVVDNPRTMAIDDSASVMAVSGSCGANLTWSFDAKGVLQINGTGSMTNYGSIASVPWYQYQSQINKVVISDGVTRIGDYAFYGCAAQIVQLPNSLQSIGRAAFWNLTNISTFTIPKNVTSIEAGALSGGASGNSILQNIIVDAGNTNFVSVDGVLYSKDKKTILAFPCGRISNYSVPSGTSEIGAYAFCGAMKINAITLPMTVKSIGESAFNTTSVKELVIPESVTSIGERAFAICSNLQSVTINGPVSRINDYLFTGCKALKSISLPKTVNYIGYNVFWDCSNLSDIHYGGTKEEWDNVEKNSDLPESSTISYGTQDVLPPSEKFPFSAPVLSKVENVNGGVKITWGKVTGAAKYRVFRKTAGGNWAKVADTTAVTYTDKTASSGTKYIYTVRCISSDGKTFTSSFDATGKTITYIAAPVLSKVENVNGGVKITWGKVTGAVKYRVFRKTAGGNWAKVADTTAVTYTDKTASSGTKYIYTVRCISGDGKAFTSSFDVTGKTITYIAAPVLSKVENVNGGVKITWGKVTGAVKYRVFRKTAGGNWAKVADTTAVSYIDKTVKCGTNYIYTVRCISSDGKTFTSSFDSTGKAVVCTKGWRQLYIDYINKVKSANTYEELCLIYIDSDAIPELYMPSPVAVSEGKICWIKDGKVAEKYCGDYIGYNDRSGDFYSLRIHSGIGVLRQYKLSNGIITETQIASYGNQSYKWQGKEVSESQWWNNLDAFEKGYSARVNTYVTLDQSKDYVNYISSTFYHTGKWVIDEWQTEPRLPGNKTLTDIFGTAYNHDSYMNINKDRTIEYYICAGHSGKGTYYIQNGHVYANITSNNKTETIELILISEEDVVVWIKNKIEGYQIYWTQD